MAETIGLGLLEQTRGREPIAAKGLDQRPMPGRRKWATKPASPKGSPWVVRVKARKLQSEMLRPFWVAEPWLVYSLALKKSSSMF